MLVSPIPGGSRGTPRFARPVGEAHRLRSPRPQRAPAPESPVVRPRAPGDRWEGSRRAVPHTILLRPQGRRAGGGRRRRRSLGGSAVRSCAGEAWFDSLGDAAAPLLAVKPHPAFSHSILLDPFFGPFLSGPDCRNWRTNGATSPQPFHHR